MKASGLRIGNLFEELYSKNIIEVIGLTNEEITFNGEFIRKWQARPIPLTKKWLLKFGFEFNKHKNWHNFKLKDFYINYSKIDIEDLVDANCFYSMNGNIKIKYVHELQNIYYVFYKKELMIQE